VKFEQGEPRRPFEQLMSVFPKQSGHALPSCYRWLMSDSKSPIIDFYPVNFRLDVNGAAFAWMGVNLLPFIEAGRLQKAMHNADKGHSKLTAEEKNRNKRIGDINLYYTKSD
jgi:5'-3' exoribonuclease 2